MTPIQKLIDQLEIGGQTKYTTHFIKKLATKLLEEEKQMILDVYCQAKKEHIAQAECYPPQFVLNEAKSYYNEIKK
jgi:hypothetical protein